MERPRSRPRVEATRPSAGAPTLGAPSAAPRVGLLGGSFDPVHSGHLHVARAALAAFDLTCVVFVPAAQAPHKRGRPWASDRDRVAMLELAIAGEPRFEVSDIELRRGGVSFTIDTVRALPRELSLPEDCEIYLVLGSDNLPGLPHWHQVRELLERVQPIVVHRAGDPDLLLGDLRDALGETAYAKLKAGYLRLPPVEVSSTELRASIQGAERGGREIPPAVRDYIRAHGIYGAES